LKYQPNVMNVLDLTLSIKPRGIGGINSMSTMVKGLKAINQSCQTMVIKICILFHACDNKDLEVR
jgi:hypothetical protein